MTDTPSERDFETRVQLAEERANTGHKELSGKLDVVVSEMHHRTEAIVSEMRQRTEELRSEMRQGTEELRSEMRQGTEELRSEMRQRTDALSSDMRHNTEAIAGLKGDLTALRSEVREDYRSTRTTVVVTAIGSALAILAIMLTTQANLLTAFQTGLTALTTVNNPSAPAPSGNSAGGGTQLETQP